MQKLICSYCGKEYKASYVPKVPYCSTECRKRDNTKVCPVCGKAFMPHRKTQMYCSKKCADEQRHQESSARRTRTCEVCGKEFVMPHPSGKARRGEIRAGMFCSNKCRGKWQAKQANGCVSPEDPFKKKYGFKEGACCRLYIRRCPHCGELFARGKKRKFCSDECGRNYWLPGGVGYEEELKRMREEYEPQIKTEKICGQCGNLFMGHNRDRYCSETCRQRARRLIKRYSNSNILRLHAEANGKRFNPIDVLVRDGWRCQLCGKKLKPKHRGTYRDDAPELDHIIPLAQGGEHSKRNTQCACRKCNQKKGSTPRGQLLLFG